MSYQHLSEKEGINRVRLNLWTFADITHLWHENLVSTIPVLSTMSFFAATLEGRFSFEDRDRYRFYLILQRAVDTFHCLIHGFCFMTNHIHIVMQAGEIPLSQIMQNISLR